MDEKHLLVLTAFQRRYRMLRRKYGFCAVDAGGVHLDADDMAAVAHRRNTSDVKVTDRMDDVYPIELSCMVDDVEVFSLYTFKEIRNLNLAPFLKDHSTLRPKYEAFLASQTVIRATHSLP